MQEKLDGNRDFDYTDFRGIAEQLQLFAIALNTSGDITFCNTHFLTLTGYSEQELLGQNWFDLFIKEHLEEIRTIFLKAVNAGEIQKQFENPITDKKGATIHVKWNNTLIRDSKGTIQGVFCIGENITPQKTAEEKLIYSENQFRLLTEASPVGIFMTDEKGKTIYVNPKWCEISGLKKEDGLEDKWLDAVHPEDKKIILEGWQAAVKEKNVSIREYRFISKKGKITWVFGQSSPFFNQEGELLGYIGSITDITDRKEAEQALRHSEEKFNKAFQNSPDAIIITSTRDGSLLEVNESLLKKTGYTREELIGKKPHEIHLWAIPEDQQEYISILRKEGKISGFQTKFIAKNGHLAENVISAEMFEMNGERYVLSIIRDISELKKANELLEHQQVLMNEMGEVAKIGGWEFNVETGEGSWSDEVARIHDLEPGDSTSKAIGLDFYQGNDRRLIEEAIKDAIENKKTYNLELEITTAKGKRKWINTIGRPTVKNGKVVSIRGSFQDITEKKLEQDSLLKSEALIRTAVDYLPLIMYRIDKNGIFTLSIGAGLSGLGLKPNEVVGMSAYDVYKDFPQIIDAINKGFKGEKAYFYVTINESNYDSYIIPVYNTRGKQDGIAGVAMDVTQRVQAEKALRASELKYRKIFDNIQDVFYQVDMEGIIQEMSYSVERFSGFTREELIGKPVSLFYVNPDDRIPFIQEVFEKKAVWDYEIKMRRKDGVIRHASINAHILYDENSQPIGLEGSLRDVEERKVFEAEIIKEKEKAEESDRLKTAFLHNISHEIRTPMNAIMGFTQLLKDSGTFSENQNTYFGIIQQSSTQLLSIIEDIVNISRIEARLVTTNIEAFNLNESLENLYKQYSLKADNKGISFTYSPGIEEDDSQINTDGTKLIQIITNLLDNAFKFTEEGEIHFGYKLNGSWLEFQVKDSGIGIRKEEEEKIFETFYQVKKSIDTLYEGTGLGLSICKAYVELLGGKIGIKTGSGPGTTFEFSIPYERVSGNSQSSNKKKTSTMKGNSKTILVAEDDDTNFDLIEIYLAPLKAEIIRAVNGLEAVNICKENQDIDLVLMDLKMPVKNGYDALLEIKAFLPDMKVIAQSAYAFDEDKATKAGFDTFISKPFTEEGLVKSIQDALKKG